MITKFFISLSFLLLGFPFIHAQENSVVKKGAKLELIASGFKFTEGPATDKDGNVYFTDQPNNKILKWSEKNDSIATFMENAGRSNGLFFDDEGNLYACADEKFELWKITPKKDVTVLLDNYNDEKFNGPNDLWIDSKGGIYLTDPYYQRSYWERKKPEMENKQVYYLSPDRTQLKMVASNFVSPNGIIGSSEKGILYISDIGDKKTYSYQISDDGSLKNRKLFTNLGSDGMTMDNKGNVYLTGNGVTVFNSSGKQIEHIAVDKDWTANVTFGGKNRSVLFITASDAVFKIEMNTQGEK